MRRIVRVSAILMIVTAAGLADAARSLVERGNRAYQQGQFDKALEAYEQAARVKPEAAEIWFNIGDAYYRLGDYRAAMGAYEQAAVRSRRTALEARSKFNQGNACFRQALAEGATDPSRALEGLATSVRLYQDALKLDPALDDARHNIEVARRLMKQFEEKQPAQAGEGRSRRSDSPEKPEPGQQQARAGEPRRPAPPSAQIGPAQAEPKPSEPAAGVLREILEQERENRRRRQAAAAGGNPRVEKDW
jgi:Ca-activated chloride channel family protein